MLLTKFLAAAAAALVSAAGASATTTTSSNAAVSVVSVDDVSVGLSVTAPAPFLLALPAMSEADRLLEKRLDATQRKACQVAARNATATASAASRPSPTRAPPAPRTNALRRRHGRRDFQFSASEQASAQAWANSGVWAHNRNGQNMWSGTTASCGPAVNAWYAELSLISSGSLINNIWRYAGHVTQLLDTRSTHMGCGVGRKSVCNYYPAGNLLGTRFYF
ncbi:CAP domain-containing protein [Entophlyctis helioformis]|nr:CAP domain-containing protein [Entophlyctis helioformis]